MNYINVFIIDFPKRSTASEAVTENEDGGFTIFINARISAPAQREAYKHALKHINNGDFSRCERVTDIEYISHKVD